MRNSKNEVKTETGFSQFVKEKLNFGVF